MGLLYGASVIRNQEKETMTDRPTSPAPQSDDLDEAICILQNFSYSDGVNQMARVAHEVISGASCTSNREIKIEVSALDKFKSAVNRPSPPMFKKAMSVIRAALQSTAERDAALAKLEAMRQGLRSVISMLEWDLYCSINYKEGPGTTSPLKDCHGERSLKTVRELRALLTDEKAEG